MHRVLSRIALVLASCTSGACYTYSAVPIADIPAGTNVRARISPAEAERLFGALNREDRLLEGQLLDVQSSELLLAVPTTVGSRPGLAPAQLHQRVNIPRSELVEVEVRELSRWRTGLLVGTGIAAAAYVIATQFVHTDEPTGDDKPNPNNIVVPLIRFR